MQTTDYLLEATAGIWAKYNEHPFVLGIQNGTLDKDKFRYYIIQDYLYLEEYAKTFAIGAAKAKSQETLQIFTNYIQALTGGGGLYDRQALYLGRQYVILFLIAAVAATPFPHRLAERLEQSSTGVGIALYRLGEKVIPAAILLLSVAGVVDASYNPFLYFRF